MILKDTTSIAFMIYFDWKSFNLMIGYDSKNGDCDMKIKFSKKIEVGLSGKSESHAKTLEIVVLGS